MNLAMDLIREALLGGSGSGGGGGGGGLELIKTVPLGHITTASTTQEDTGKTIVIDDFADYDFLLLVFMSNIDDDSVGNICNVTMALVNKTGRNSSPTHNVQGYRYNMSRKLDSSVKYIYRNSNSTAYGVYATNGTISNGTITFPVMKKYNSSIGTIDWDYTAYVYGIKFLGG